MSDIQLPIVLEPMDSESAMGYILRCAHANGTNLHSLRRAIGMPDVGLLTDSNARSLAWLMQCSESWLAAGLGRLHKDAGVSTLHCWGQKFFAPNHVRRKWPQLCPECIHRDGYCRRVWDLSMATICVRHKRRFIDECMNCHSRVRWDRPSVDICQCGYGFETDRRHAHIEDAELSFASLLEELISDDLSASHSNLTALPMFLRNMSVSGLVMLIEILGRLDFEHQVVRTSHRTKSFRTHEWDDIVTRALSRLPFLEHVNPQSRMLIDQVALERLFQRSTNPVELQVASLLASHLPRTERSAKHGSGIQMPLFS
jgi:TniQ